MSGKQAVNAKSVAMLRHAIVPQQAATPSLRVIEIELLIRYHSGGNILNPRFVLVDFVKLYIGPGP